MWAAVLPPLAYGIPMQHRTAAIAPGNLAPHKRVQRTPNVRSPRKAQRHARAADLAHRSNFTFRRKVATVIWLSILIVVVMAVFQDTIAQLGSWGYLGAFLINGISSATIVLPAPGGAIVMLMAPDYHPLLLGIAAGLGGAVGSLTSYLVGTHARTTFQRRRRTYSLAHRMMHRFGSVILLLATLMPISPGDFAGLLAGATRYPLRKYFLYVAIASVIKMTVMVYVAAASLAWLQEWLQGWNELIPG